MKFKSLIAAITSLVAIAATDLSAANKDLSTLLAEENKFYVEQIKSQRGTALIVVADQITGSGVSDTNLFNAVSEKLQFLISEHELNPKSKDIPEEINAVMRALASMGTQSREIIVDIQHRKISRGVAERAKRLPEKLYWFSERDRIMQNAKSFQPGQSLMAHRFLNLIEAEDSTFGRWALEEIERRNGTDSIVYDRLREILASQRTQIKNPVHLDYLAWICKTLSKFDAEKSRDLLMAIDQDPSQDKFSVKLKKYARPS